MNTNYLKLGTLVLLIACAPKPDMEALKAEVAQAEKAFNDYAQEKGVKEAFLAFAHETAVINRNDSIIGGKEGIATYFDGSTLLNAKLQWAPDFVDVSSSGDLAYTYGTYTFNGMRQDSTEINASGIFHTVWKKDKNGEWKFVYD